MTIDWQVWLWLFAVCVVYALLLEAMHARYNPWWTWFTVVIGDGFILLGIWVFEQRGVELTFWRCFWTFVAAGVPIIIWQLAQNGARLLALWRDAHGTQARRKKTL